MQIRRHGSEDHDWQGGGRSLFAQWRARDCTSGSGYCVQLQSHLPPEPALRQTQGAKGSAHLRDIVIQSH